MDYLLHGARYRAGRCNPHPSPLKGCLQGNWDRDSWPRPTALRTTPSGMDGVGQVYAARASISPINTPLWSQADRLMSPCSVDTAKVCRTHPDAV